MNRKPIYITKPNLPPIEEFNKLLSKIWGNRILTNDGPFHLEFEKKLSDFLGVNYLSLFSNGTLALITALQALKITGEVITTPFSFVATSHALWWNGIKSVFSDIDPINLNLDPEKIEAAITPKTTAILPVHVYGTPCDVVKIKEIADRYELKLIYDAAHAFGVKSEGISIANFGDLSILSFHATKVFNTFEGGAIVCHDEQMKKHIDNLKNFGITNETTVVAPGINGKMNEFQAALGILQLKYVDKAVDKRKHITEIYTKAFKDIPGITTMHNNPGVEPNYGYFPILIDSDGFGNTRDFVYETLRKQNVYSRRYFYPLISQFPTYRGLDSAQPGKMPVAERITKEVLCLPIYPDLEFQDVDFIIEKIRNLQV